jgi:hypothetical protein
MSVAGEASTLFQVPGTNARPPVSKVLALSQFLRFIGAAIFIDLYYE